MNLKELISRIKVDRIMGNPEVNIEGLTYDSRKVKRGYLFVAIRGFKKDGHQFIPEAIKRGAKAVVVEKEMDKQFPIPKITVIKVASSRLALSRLSAHWYGFPSQKLRVIGITGTNGKTTIAYLLESIFKTSGLKVGKLSTIDYDLGSGVYPSSITTPESQDLQRMLRIMVDQGLECIVMEVSSHSLILYRTEGVEFDQAVFTNFSPEHLDFHHNLRNYLEAKTSLFRGLGRGAKKKTTKAAIINIDDPAADYIISNTSVKVVTYGIKKNPAVQGKILTTGLNGTSFLVKTKEAKGGKINLALLGIHNVYNSLAAISVALEEKIDFPIIKKGLEKINKV
ncbi:MAG: UDP-N-acetylmuramoyl-L-alanyl-D-glutamate--2,6-diaminopimelate ligase, partial [Candidatus Aerophobetes bacterium]|nr:UDP-N-acetylmuramoyl-L-alanyl-D-glutamate--2,6-diaminopimelate ligase [Candidatus Aerophobetes bacterium]